MAALSVECFATVLLDYNWHVLFRAEYLCSIFDGILFMLLADTLFPGAIHKWVFRGYLALCGAYPVMVLVTKPMFFTRALALFQIASIVAIAYLLLQLAMTLQLRRQKNVLAVLGLGLFGLFSVYDMLHRNGLLDGINAQGWFIIDATAALAEAEARYHKLLQYTQSDTPASDKLACLGLTKREAEVALLLFDARSRNEIAVLLYISLGTVNYHCSNLYRKAGVKSVNELTAPI